MGYNRNPAHLQCLIRTLFREATSAIEVQGTRVVGLPLFETLDGRDTGDYVQRVEPSVAGGQKMARAIVDCILEHL